MFFHCFVLVFWTLAGFSAGPHGKYAWQCPCLMLLTTLLCLEAELQAEEPKDWDYTSLYLLHPCLQNKKTSMLTGPGCGWCFLDHMFFLTGCQSQNIQEPLAEKISEVCFHYFVILSRQHLNSVRVENKQIQQQQQQQPGERVEAHWLGLQAGRPSSGGDFLILACLLPVSCFLFIYLSQPGFHNEGPELKAVLSLRPEISGNVIQLFSPYSKERNINSDSWIIILRQKRNAGVDHAFSELLRYDPWCVMHCSRCSLNGQTTK